MIKLVALDMDDTLLNTNHEISPRTAEVIRQATMQGVTVTIATGRMYSSARPFAEGLGLDVPLITYNGAMIKAVLSGETLLHCPVESAVARQVLAFFRERGWYIQSYVNDVLYVEQINDKARYYEKLAKIPATAVGDDLYTKLDCPTKLLALAEPTEIIEMRDVLKPLFGDRLYIAISKPNFLEMVNPAVNKGMALSFLAKQLGIGHEQVMAVGDSFNDLDMIEYAGWGVAMGNAPDEVKRRAQAVVASNAQDGVAEAFEKYVLR